LAGSDADQGARTYEFDLFVSYASEDHQPVERLVNLLRRDGYLVWFDRRDMPATGSVSTNLGEALGKCRQTLICLSDTYCQKDFTHYELQLNFELSPANRDKRTIPVIVNGPLNNEAVPEAVRWIPRIDLTDNKTYEEEYRRLKRSIVPISRPLPSFPSPAEVQAYRKLSDPVQALVALRQCAVKTFAFIHRHELGQPAPADWMHAADALVTCPTLAAAVRMHIGTVQMYARLIDDIGLGRESIEPAFQALLGLSTWAFERYGLRPPASDPLAAFWSVLTLDLPSAELPFQLAGGRRGLTAAGAVYLGQGVDGRSKYDLVLVPVEASRAQELNSEVERLRHLGELAPLAVWFSKVYDFPGLGVWSLVGANRPEGVSPEALAGRSRPVPRRLGVALARQVLGSFETMAEKAPILTASLFLPDNVLVDRAGVVRLAWNWDRPGAQTETEAEAAPAQRSGFWFGRLARSGSAASEVGRTREELRRALGEALGETAPDILSKDLATSASASSEDGPVLNVAVESFLGDKELPIWVTAEPEPPPVEPPPPPPPPPVEPPVPPPVARTRPRILIDCHCAWPLGTEHLLVWDAEDVLGIWAIESGAWTWRDAAPFHLRVSSQGPGDGVAVGSWEGEIRWFAGGFPDGATRLGGTIGDIRALGCRWIAGSWNEKLQLLGGGAPATSLPDVAGGVRRIATSDSDCFAVLSLQGAVSLYRGSHRVTQTGSIPDAIDLAFASGALVVLTGAGLVTISAAGQPVGPDRLPSGAGARLLYSPLDRMCLLVNEQGQSWYIDPAGTYPRGPVLAPGDRTVTTARSFTHCIGITQLGGYAYWRDGVRIHSWREAVSAVLSQDGRRVVATLPGEIEVREDSE